MGYPEHSIRLDTGAFRVARATRIGRGASYWLILACGAAAVVVAISMVVPRLASPDRGAAVTFSVAPPAAVALATAPPIAATRVAIWNATRHPSATVTTTHRLAGLGYRLVPGHGPAMKVRGRLVLYAPGNEAAALAVARRLGLDPSRAVHPLDGISPSAISPAVVLVVVGR